MNQQSSVTGKQVTVLGSGRSGRAVSNLLVRSGAAVFLSDCHRMDAQTRRWCHQRGIDYEECGHTEAVLQADFVVISPGVPSSDGFVQQALAMDIPIYSELEVASWYAPGGPVIAITGTNGKTTTASLIAHMLNTSHRSSVLAGNIGTPLSEHVLDLDSDTVIVLEVSSFQLDHVDSFRPDVSVLLNITSDHLDRYDGHFEHYAQSKLRIYENQSTQDVVVYNYDDTLVRKQVEFFTSTSDVQGLPFSCQVELSQGADALRRRIRLQEKVLMSIDDLQLHGPHNVSNSLAAALAGQSVGLNDATLCKSLREFGGIDHRLEVVRRIEGVTYINDSKATNVDALKYALSSFSSPIVLLAGGRDKGNDYEVIKPLIQSKVHTLIAFGESAPKMLQELGPYTDLAMASSTLDDATRQAHQNARQGDVVLLSPACSSLDQYSSYEERGAVFRHIVEEF
ncbi:MAG: UDP-N-acetylmuramoyl-L-alanine--D-glutamate ligase [Bacteroidetes bacterium]|nr:UDP-N-acetylmuramoyl-L-alanine--D-glutamate ligase [Bacteroidota bacterium]